MTLDLAAILRDAWRGWKRDRDWLTGVAGMLIFAPQLAALLFVPRQPPWPENPSDQAALAAWIDSAAKWSASYAPVLLLCDVLAIYGTLTLYIVSLAPGRPDVRAALHQALRQLPRFVVAALLVQFFFQLGIALFVLPGLYIAGRTALVGAIFAAERPRGILPAIRASFARTRGYGLVLTALSGITIISGAIAAAVLRLLGESLGRAPLANPVSALLIDGGVAAATTLGAIATILARAAVYRRIGAREG